MVVIDVLDESDGVQTWRDAVPKTTDLLGNFHFAVTSPPLDDINVEFDGAPHIRQTSMDDITTAVAERDIHAFISSELEGLGFQGKEFVVLAEKVDGLFEWARLICEHIKESYICLVTKISGCNNESKHASPRTCYIPVDLELPTYKPQSLTRSLRKK